MIATAPDTTIRTLLSAQSIGANLGYALNFDLSKVKTAQIFIAIDRTFDLQFYPMMDMSSNNIPAAQNLASNVAPPATGRTQVYTVPSLPSPAGRFTVTNKDATLAATVSIWIADRNN